MIVERRMHRVPRGLRIGISNLGCGIDYTSESGTIDDYYPLNPRKRTRQSRYLLDDTCVIGINFVPRLLLILLNRLLVVHGGSFESLLSI